MSEQKIRVSKQKLYDSIVAIEKKYGSLANLGIFASYVPIQGLRLGVTDRQLLHTLDKSCTLDITDCFEQVSKFEATEKAAERIEQWFKQKNW